MELTKNELQIMTVMWQAAKPLTGTEIRKRSVGKTWKDSSIHIILNKLLDKGAIEEYGFVKDGKSIARTFTPSISREDYYGECIAGYADEDVPILLSALLRRTDLDSEAISKLKDIIRDWETGAES